jgi:ribonuclease P protein component
MLEKKYRLPATVKLLHSSSFNSRSFRCLYSLNNLSISRFGFVAGKKIDKRSVVRNKAKRKLRSCIEEVVEKIIDGYDMLFIMHKESLSINRTDFFAEVQNFLSKEKLIK